MQCFVCCCVCCAERLTVLGLQNIENKNEFRITTLSRGLTIAPPSQTEPTAPAAAPAAPAVPTTDTTPVPAVTSSYTLTVDSNAAELLKIRKKADTVESAQGGIPLLAILRPYSQLADYIEVRFCITCCIQACNNNNRTCTSSVSSQQQHLDILLIA
jgi:hypothetical protein